MFAQSDQHHLHEAAFYVADELSVGLDPVAHHDMVGAVGVFVEVHRKPLVRIAHYHRLHAGTNRATADRCGNPKRFEQLLLPFSTTATVAPHRRHDKRFSAELLEMTDGGFDDLVDARDAATADGDSDGLPGLDLFVQGESLQLLLDLGGQVVDLGHVEVLTDAKYLGIFSHLLSYAEGAKTDPLQLDQIDHVAAVEQTGRFGHRIEYPLVI